MHRETVYLCVVDRDRMALSLIYSTYHAFGSGLASARFGINFHSRGAGFSLAPGHPNEAAGGKRPMHTIIPAVLRRDGRVVMPFGVMGGAYQPAGHVRFLTNLSTSAWTRRPRSTARAASPRRRAAARDRLPERVAAELAAMGHR